MKQYLIKKYFNTREKIESALKLNNGNYIGTREELIKRLNNLSYLELKNSIIL